MASSSGLTAAVDAPDTDTDTLVSSPLIGIVVTAVGLASGVAAITTATLNQTSPRKFRDQMKETYNETIRHSIIRKYCY
jgi:hypothetical protein